MANAVELAIKVTAATADAQSGLEAVGDAAATMAGDVAQAASKADNAASKLDSLGSSAETLDSKTAAATGSLGALSSGFELVGAEKYAAGLQSAALATDFLSGVGQALVLVTEAGGLANLKTTATTYAKTAAEKASAAATKASAAAQWALNAAMEANPIGLVVVAIVALIAGFVLLYKKSDTFRALVDRLWSGIKTGVTAAAAVLKTALSGALSLAGGYFRTMWTVAQSVFSAIRTAVGTVRTVIGGIRDTVGNVIDKLRNLTFPGAFTAAVDAVRDAIDGLIGAVETLVGWIGKIKIPSIPHIPGLGRSAAAGVAVATGAARGRTRTAGGPAAGGQAVQVVINFNGPTVDKYGTATQIERLLARRGLILTGRVS